jgi:hypothetical protein
MMILLRSTERYNLPLLPMLKDTRPSTGVRGHHPAESKRSFRRHLARQVRAHQRTKESSSRESHPPGQFYEIWRRLEQIRSVVTQVRCRWNVPVNRAQDRSGSRSEHLQQVSSACFGDKFGQLDIPFADGEFPVGGNRFELIGA